MHCNTDMTGLEGYEALRSGAAWIDVSSRGRIRVTGEDRARLLHAMTTNQVQQLTPGTGCYAFFLSAQGRILADVNLLCRDDYFLLDTEPETHEKVYGHLDKYIIADDVTLEDVTESLAAIAIEGPQSAEIMRKLGAPLRDAEYGSDSWDSWLVARLSYAGASGLVVFLPPGDKAQLTGRLEEAGAVQATSKALRVVRIENGRPRYGEDISERFLAQETNQSRALNFNKGCYLGQEIVERVRSRGQIHRVLTPLRIDSSVPPEPGTKLLDIAGANAAEITSAAFSPALGKVVALAYVRAEHAKPNEKLRLGETEAVVAGC